MFTPQRKTRPDWSSTPTKLGGTSVVSKSTRSVVSKGKAVAIIDKPPPPLNSLGGGGDVITDVVEEYTEDWQRFREAGLLDEATLQQRDQEALMERVSKLENELFDYQYNMGLLLIEKKEWATKFEELSQALAEAHELLKREKAASMNAISEMEKREENLRKALGVEKQCVVDLEKALREMRTESAETKYTADSKMAEANALIANIEDKSLTIEAKLHAADAKLAEANRKSSEIERKLKEIEARESSVRSERQSFNAEQAMHESNLAKQRKELLDWDATLREREERLIEGRRVINQREEKANERDLILEKKEKDLEEADKKFGSTNASLRMKEEDINRRLADISAKEEEIEAMKKNIDLKEKELVALEEKLNVRERVEIQKLIDDHNATLESKQNAFELEMDHKRKSVDEELRSRFVEVEQKEIEIRHMEEKISKREQALDKKMEKLKEKEKNLDSKSQSLRDREKSTKIQEKEVETEKKQMAVDKENMQILIAELEKKRADLEVEQLRLHEGAEKLKVTEEERTEFLRLQSDLKQEIESWNRRKEVLMKEEENLKQDRENFEKEWEVLDEKRVEVTEELKRVSAEKESLEKMINLEGETLKNEKLATKEYVQREKENLRLEKESFEAMMDHERSVAVEKARNEHEDMLRKFQLQERELKAEIQNKWEEMERDLRERERAFEEQKDRDLKNVKYLKQEVQREMEDLKLERLKIEKERQKISADKQHLEGQQLDLRKDIDKLDNLIKNLRLQRAQFKKLAEKYKSCTNCGEIISDFILSDLHSLEEMEDFEALSSPRRSERYLESMQGNLASSRLNSDTSPLGTESGVSASGGRISWIINKCASKIIKLSPRMKSKDEVAQALADESSQPVMEARTEARAEPLNGEVAIANAQELSPGIPSDSYDERTIHSGNSARDIQAEPAASIGEQFNMGSTLVVPEDSQQSELKTNQAKNVKKRNGAVRRTRSVKAVVEESKAILGLSDEQKEDKQQNGSAKAYEQVNEESRDDSSIATKKSGQKRTRTRAHASSVSEQGVGENDTHSESVTTAGGRRKRRQTVAPGLQTPGEKRYNFRERKGVGTPAATQAATDLSKGKEKEADGAKAAEDNEADGDMAAKEIIANLGEAGGAKDAEEVITHLGQVTTVTTIVEEVQYTSERFDTVGENDGTNAYGTKSINKIGSSEEGNEVNETSGVHFDEDAFDSNAYATKLSENDDLIQGVNEAIEQAGEYVDVDEDGFESEIGGEDGFGDEDADDTEHPGEKSIGKKLWTFFTT